MQLDHSIARAGARAIRSEIANTTVGIAAHPRLTTAEHGFGITLTHADGKPNGQLRFPNRVRDAFLDACTRLGITLPTFGTHVEAACAMLNTQLHELQVTVRHTFGEDQLTAHLVEHGEDYPEPQVDVEELVVTCTASNGEVWEEMLYIELDHLLPRETFERVLAAMRG